MNKRASSQSFVPSWRSVVPREVTAALTPVDRVLTCVLRLDTAHDDPGLCRELILRVDDWDELLVAARVHGLQPLLYGALRRHGLSDAVPFSVAGVLRSSYLASAAFASFALVELGRIAAALAAQDTRAMSVKGPILGTELYADPAERPFSDLDLLVKEESWPAFRETLLALGYKAGEHDTRQLPLRLLPQVGLDHVYEFTGPQGLRVEVKFDPLELGLQMHDIAGVWERAVDATTPAGAPLLRPSREDELLMLCVHLNRHGYQRLLWLADIAFLVSQQGPEIDWNLLGARARAEGVESSVHHTLRLAGLLLGTPIPAVALERTAPSPVRKRVWRSTWPLADVLAFGGAHEAALVFRKRLTCPWLAKNLLLTGRVAEKTAYFARRAVPPREFLLDKYRTEQGGSSYLRALGQRYRTALRRPRKAQV
ncbi:MAG TPA: nucleotidyltransferase family protein [Coriobacteriia bacterium]|nr:nucleotidyltransferase family protein [Coriobacteriia bacterium]